MLFTVLMTGGPASAQFDDEGSMSGDEINDMIDETVDESSASSGRMSGMDGTTTASTPPPSDAYDFSSKARELDGEVDEDTDVDREMNDSGDHEVVSDRWNTPEPEYSAPTPIPTGDSYNAPFAKKSKKKVTKKSKSKKKGKLAKQSKSKKKGKIAKKSPKKSKNRRVASRHAKKYR